MILKFVLFGKWIRTIFIYWRVPKFWWLVKLVKLLCFLNRIIFPLLVLLRVIIWILWFGIVVFVFLLERTYRFFYSCFGLFDFYGFIVKLRDFEYFSISIILVIEPVTHISIITIFRLIIGKFPSPRFVVNLYNYYIIIILLWKKMFVSILLLTLIFAVPIFIVLFVGGLLFLLSVWNNLFERDKNFELVIYYFGYGSAFST